MCATAPAGFQWRRIVQEYRIKHKLACRPVSPSSCVCRPLRRAWLIDAVGALYPYFCCCFSIDLLVFFQWWSIVVSFGASLPIWPISESDSARMPSPELSSGEATIGCYQCTYAFHVGRPIRSRLSSMSRKDDMD